MSKKPGMLRARFMCPRALFRKASIVYQEFGLSSPTAAMVGAIHNYLLAVSISGTDC